MIEPQIIKSKKANSYVGYSRTRESEIMDLIAHKKWLDDYNTFCQTNERQNAWRKKFVIENGNLVKKTSGQTRTAVAGSKALHD